MLMEIYILYLLRQLIGWTSRHFLIGVPNDPKKNTFLHPESPMKHCFIIYRLIEKLVINKHLNRCYMIFIEMFSFATRCILFLNFFWYSPNRFMISSIQSHIDFSKLQYQKDILKDSLIFFSKMRFCFW